MTDTTTVPTLSTVDDAHALLRQLAETHDWVSVFWDRGWGDHGETAEISIIVDGNGAEPKAHVMPEVYRALVDRKIVEGNSYGGFKKRRIHDFQTPPKPERTGPNPTEVAEGVVRSVLATVDGMSVRARFYRGANPGNALNPVNEEVVQTAGFDRGWYVLVCPGHSDAVVTGWGNDYSGFGDTVGEANLVTYPKSGDGVIDEMLLAALLAEAVEEKVAEVQAARAAV